MRVDFVPFGTSAAKMIRRLKRYGYKAKRTKSPYRGNVAVEVAGPLSAKQRREVKVIIFPEYYNGGLLPKVRKAVARATRR